MGPQRNVLCISYHRYKVTSSYSFSSLTNFTRNAFQPQPLEFSCQKGLSSILKCKVEDFSCLHSFCYGFFFYWCLFLIWTKNIFVIICSNECELFKFCVACLQYIIVVMVDVAMVDVVTADVIVAAFCFTLKSSVSASRV